MGTCDLWEEQISMRVEWKCAITGSGAQSVMICGVHQMLVLPANSLVTQELVGNTFMTYLTL